ncbi:hypothetical protein [Halorubrum sp. HHNYT27]|uniref:hypothetical protein n=1 Tax=Halorubrum sp. HHNYT27 TaxID=3402275 RepID=UPI003EBCB393
MVTRRTLLFGTATLVSGLSGCIATQRSSSPQVVCAAGIDSGDSNPVFSLTPTVRSFGANTNPVVELVVPIRQAVVESQNVRELVVFSESEVRYRIPVSPNDDPVGETNRYDTDDVVEYAQSLGHVPQNGVYRLVALDGDGESLDEDRIDFRCYRVVDEESD